MGKRWKLKKCEDGKWKLVGVYGEKFIPQLAATYGRIAKQGLEPYKEIKVEEVKEDS